VLVLSFISWTTPLFPASPAYAALERVPHKVVAVGRLELIIDHSAILVPALSSTCIPFSASSDARTDIVSSSLARVPLGSGCS
jgi:hypothetical protein